MSAAVLRAIAVGLAVLAAGCRPTPAPSDPDLARETLRQALEAWKRGDPPDALAKADPPVVAADRQWQGGAKLLDYTIHPAVEPKGFDQHFTATLSLQDAAGKRTQQKAAYDVSTTPKRVVVRGEG
jgi:hypothetical protein